ncbi:MAG TPA: hypothetical protein VHL77_13305 [Ferruginibacter sp.]|jgi:hypothetical protein|nr:hypothetical protein [Ferruginibacter sp.]
MGDHQKSPERSRRWFLSLFTGADKNTSNTESEKVKMLTADGKLVEIDKSVLEAATRNQKSTNKEIYDWMENPSKENQ